jgi:acetyl esterase/lipase
MLWAILILIIGVASAAAVVNAFRPVRWDWFLLPSLVWSLVVIELPVQLILLELAAVAILAMLGGLGYVVGQIGLVLLALSWIGSIVLFIRSRGSLQVVARSLDSAAIPASGNRVSFWRVLVGLPFRGRAIEKIKNVEFSRVAGRVLRLDVYRSRTAAENRPVLLYLHGGAWMVGDKFEQGLPMLHHLARNGWVCFSANYRLSPGATFPDHLIDAKAALAWVKKHAHEYGGDPSFVAVSGGSAGGHLASLVALTANDERYQPPDKAADTSVQAAVPIYGITDLTNRLGAQSDRFVSMIMEPVVMKAFLAEEPEKYRDGSPIDLVQAGAPPFLIIQGERDTLAPVVEARAFVARLGEVSESQVVYMEFPGAQHIFDLFYSYRAARMIDGVTAFLEHVRSGG